MDIEGKRRISVLDMKIVKMCNWIMIAYYILRNIICINQITVINFHVYLPKFFPSKFAVKNYRAVYDTNGHLEESLSIN